MVMGASKLKIEDGTIELRSFRLAIPEFTVAGGLTQVLGANGSGKTTLFRVALGVRQLDAGQRHLRAGATLGYVPQNYREALFPWLSALRMLEIMSVPLGEASDWLQRFGISRNDLAKRSSELSGGQCQRLALVKECLLGGSVIFLDEPFSSLDRRSVEIADELIEATVGRGAAVVFTSHLELPQRLTALLARKYALTRHADDLAMVEQV